MLVFIDDSGDPGFNFAKGSSKYFALAAVIFDDNKDAEATANCIRELRQNLHWNENTEFKFNKSSKDVRCQFLESVRGCTFRIRALLVDKSLLYSDELKSSRRSFYNYMIKQLLSHSNGRIINADVRLDGHENKAYKKEALTYFRKQINDPNNKVISKVKFVDSKKDNLIQLADMVVSSIARTKSGKTDANTYFNIFKDHIEDLWNFK